jgi:hypothetical protein
LHAAILSARVQIIRTTPYLSTIRELTRNRAHRAELGALVPGADCVVARVKLLADFIRRECAGTWFLEG